MASLHACLTYSLAIPLIIDKVEFHSFWSTEMSFSLSSFLLAGMRVVACVLASFFLTFLRPFHPLSLLSPSLPPLLPFLAPPLVAGLGLSHVGSG